ncbi:MAG: SDR family NAD(P)-dependent oxidoreductase [Thiolinea sp.]
MKQTEENVAIITGASAPKGIGKAIAMRLARAGASVVLTDIAGTMTLNQQDYDTIDLLEQTVAEIQARGGKAITLPVDVTKAEDIAQCMKTTLQQFNKVDILVNNAGSLAGSDNFLNTTPEQWEKSFQVNLMGPMMFTQAIIPEMQKQGGGSIINIGSTGSLGAEAGFGAYTAMKHGLIGLTKTIAAEFGPAGIRCNVVCPGYIMTDMHAAANVRLAEENNIDVEEMMARRYANVALRQAGDPDDVAEAVAYLVSPQGKYVTGIALPVAGGVPFGI